MILVNTSRGQVINTLDLLNFLKKNKLSSAALDVIDHKYEKLCFNYLKKYKNLILTPHIGGLTKESIEMADLYLINRFLLGIPLVVTYLIGPLGLFLYWLIRIFYAKSINLYD